jgi:hypothetical protein
MSKAIQTQEVPGQSIDGVNFIKVNSNTGDLVSTTATQTLTNKTLTSPTITAGTATNTTVVDPTLTVDFQSLAAAGNAIGNAGAITVKSGGIVFVTAADATKGVQLPVAAEGALVVIKNSDAANAVLKVYPQVNSTINALSANTAISMAANTAASFYGVSATAWVTVPLLPS